MSAKHVAVSDAIVIWVDASLNLYCCLPEELRTTLLVWFGINILKKRFGFSSKELMKVLDRVLNR